MRPACNGAKNIWDVLQPKGSAALLNKRQAQRAQHLTSGGNITMLCTVEWLFSSASQCLGAMQAISHSKLRRSSPMFY